MNFDFFREQMFDVRRYFKAWSPGCEPLYTIESGLYVHVNEAEIRYVP